jgi:membrane associated rhomboid family serine protease
MAADSEQPHDPTALHDALVAEVGAYGSFADAHQHAVVVLAMNLPCWIVPSAGGYAIFADAANGPGIRRELAQFDEEQSAPTPVEGELPWFEPVRELTFLWVLVLLGVFLFQLRDPMLADAGANSSRLVIDGGEWWRPFTAMFLHSDLQHLVGNLIFGSVFIMLAARSLGPLVAWPLIFTSGVAANIITAAWHHPEPFRAIGASTAVFGALGLLTGSGILRHQSRRQRIGSLFIPLAGGLVLFGWFGLGGPGVDMLGHAAGFACGVVLGLLAVGVSKLRSHRGQSRRMRSVSSE